MVRSGTLLSAAPFLRLLVPLCLGVSLSSGVSYFASVSLNLLPIVIFIFLVWYRDGSYYFLPIWTILLLTVILLFGIIRGSQERIVFPPLQEKSFSVVVEDYPAEKAKSCRVIGRIIGSNLKILIYLPKSISSSKAEPGNILSFEGVPELIENEGNPFEFDYRRYLNDKGIGYRIFLKEGKFHICENRKFVNIYHKALIFRKKLIDRLSGSGIKKENVNMIGSISFGARDEVDKETIQSFTNTGVIHVLAVSGMNVGLIFVVLDFLLHFLKSGRAGSYLHTILVISGIWSYTLIAGMSASILRAAVMITFVIAGRSLSKHSNMINSLAASAFILIALNPSIIRDVGFQLSYAALVSIVVVQPYIYKQLFFKSFLADKTWMLLSVTLAAQLGTLPFTLLYFHQFPVYFWLANLVVVPLVSLILYLSVALLLLTLIPGFLSSMIAKVLDLSADLVLLTVRQVEKLPHAVIGSIYPDKVQIGAVVLIFFMIVIYTRSRKKFLVYGVLATAILFSVYEGFLIYYQKSRKEIVFYNIPGTRALVLTSCDRSFIIYDQCESAEEKLRRYMSPYFGERGIKSASFYPLEDSVRLIALGISIKDNYLSFYGTRIFVEPSNKMNNIPEYDVFAEITWLRDQPGHETLIRDFNHCRVILCRSSGLENAETVFPAGLKSFVMNKAVLLSVKQPWTQYSEISVDYFKY